MLYILGCTENGFLFLKIKKIYNFGLEFGTKKSRKSENENQKFFVLKKLKFKIFFIVFLYTYYQF